MGSLKDEGVAIVSVQSPDDQLIRITTFVTNDFPCLNRAFRNNTINLISWLRHVRQVVVGVQSTALALAPERRLKLLQALGFILTAAERHAQTRAAEPGWVVQLLPDLEDALLTAAGHERAPVLTAELYWERNDEYPPLSFTGEPDELFYISNMRAHLDLRAIVNRYLRALLRGEVTVDTPEGACILSMAALAMQQADGAHRGSAGTESMTRGTVNDIRTWFAQTVIRGQLLAGASTGHLAEILVTAYLLGNADSSYDAHVCSLDQYQSPEGRYQIAQDRKQSGLALLFAGALGFDASTLDQASTAEVAVRMRQATPALLSSLSAFSEIISLDLRIYNDNSKNVENIGACSHRSALRPGQSRSRPSGIYGGQPQDDLLHAVAMARRSSHVCKIIGAYGYGIRSHAWSLLT